MTVTIEELNETIGIMRTVYPFDDKAKIDLGEDLYSRRRTVKIEARDEETQTNVMLERVAESNYCPSCGCFMDKSI